MGLHGLSFQRHDDFIWWHRVIQDLVFNDFEYSVLALRWLRRCGRAEDLESGPSSAFHYLWDNKADNISQLEFPDLLIEHNLHGLLERL